MKRFRQYRLTQAVRDQYADVTPIEAGDFIYPYFVEPGKASPQPSPKGEGAHTTDCKEKVEIPSMPGVYRFTIPALLDDIEDTLSLGINKVLLFGVIPQEEKDERGSAGYKPDNIISEAVRAIKARYGSKVIVFTDICLCEYTSHGHCGLLKEVTHSFGDKRLQIIDVENDSTLPLLAEMAYQHALAGADFVAPSAMMDGQIDALRQKLDSDERTKHVRILAYSAKYASAYYGPFRDAADSAPSFGDRKTYQMDYRTKDQALQEIQADIEEGTDWIMVKPALAYLDIIYRAATEFPKHPLVAYQVSGEYSMLMNAAQQGFFDERRIFHESLTAIRRAGAKYIISYYAKRYLK